jgi:hypothetical protein
MLGLWRKKKVSPLTKETIEGFTFWGEVDDYGRSITIRVAPRQFAPSPKFKQALIEFLVDNGFKIEEKEEKIWIRDPIHDLDYKLKTPELDLITMLARYGVVLVPSEQDWH